jgi:hypothetical protein
MDFRERRDWGGGRMGCKVKISVECQVEERDTKDPKKPIIGMKWDTRPEAKKDQLLRVVATMTGNCQAKIRIQNKLRTSGMSFVNLKSAPPAPGPEVCTKHKEMIFWATTINHAAGESLPEVAFTATANCAECECENSEKESTDTAVQKFNDH